jgi:outer membrane protein assembly factor BamA
LDQITFSGATAFAIAELGEQFSLQHGDLFDEPELWNGMASITRIYRAKGFIDMISKREEKIDEKSWLVNVVFEVDEGRQYHVRTVEAHGLPSTSEQALKSQFVPGEVFDIGAFRNFVREHSPELPKAVPFDDARIQVRRDATNATVDILVDFRPCPATYRDLNLPIEAR